MPGDYYLFVLKRKKQSLLEPQIVAVQAQTLCVYYINNLVLIAAFVIFSSLNYNFVGRDTVFSKNHSYFLSSLLLLLVLIVPR